MTLTWPGPRPTLTRVAVGGELGARLGAAYDIARREHLGETLAAAGSPRPWGALPPVMRALLTEAAAVLLAQQDTQSVVYIRAELGARIAHIQAAAGFRRPVCGKRTSSEVGWLVLSEAADMPVCPDCLVRTAGHTAQP